MRADGCLADERNWTRPICGGLGCADQNGAAILVTRYDQFGGDDPGRQITRFHRDLAFEIVLAHRQDFDRECFAAAQHTTPDIRFARVFFGGWALRHGDQLEVRRFFADYQAIGIARIGDDTAEKVAHLDAAGPIFFRFEAADRIARTGLEFLAADICIDVIEFLIVDEQERIGREPETVRKHFNPPHVAFFDSEVMAIYMVGGIKLAEHVAGWLEVIGRLARRHARLPVQVSNGQAIEILTAAGKQEIMNLHDVWPGLRGDKFDCAAVPALLEFAPVWAIENEGWIHPRIDLLREALDGNALAVGGLKAELRGVGLGMPV